MIVMNWKANTKSSFDCWANETKKCCKKCWLWCAFKVRPTEKPFHNFCKLFTSRLREEEKEDLLKYDSIKTKLEQEQMTMVRSNSEKVNKSSDQKRFVKVYFTFSSTDLLKKGEQNEKLIYQCNHKSNRQLKMYSLSKWCESINRN